MQIRENYITSFNRIRDKHGSVLFSSYIIPTDVSLQGAIGYTNKYIVESGEEHYRYDYYRYILNTALNFFGIHRSKYKIFHLDLGCGPGLFSWVVQDYLLARCHRSPGDIELVGYDYAKKMIRLANLFRDYLPVEFNFEGYSRIRTIRDKLRSRDLSDCDCIVTFGYVLVQLKDNTEAMHNFAKIIKHLFPANSCTLVAVDAFSGNRPLEFRYACDELLAAMSSVGININDKYIRSPDRSWMRASLSREK